MKKTTNILEWAAEKAAYARLARAILGRDVRVLDGDPHIAPGYTGPDGKIYITREDSLWEDKTELEKIEYRKGIFAHELMHQVFTNFDKMGFVLKSLPSRERQIFSTLQNVLEDPAIEYLAQTVIGGPVLKALKYAIYNTYKDSPAINESTTPFSQYIAALIQFGDMGVLKGRFTFPETKEMFLETADLFYQGIMETNSGKRIDIAKEIHEKTRPLWEPELKKSEEEFEEFMNAVKELLKQFGKSESSGEGQGSNPSDEGLSEDESKAKRRKITIKKVSKEEYDKMKNDSSSSGSGELPDGDITLITCDEADDENEGNGQNGPSIPMDSDGNPSSDGKSNSENGETEQDKDGESEKSKDSKEGKGNSKDSKDSNDSKDSESSKSSKKSKGESKDQKKEAHREAPKDNDPCKIVYGNGKMSDDYSEFDGEIDEAEYELTKEDLDYIEREARRLQDEFSDKEFKDAADDAPIEDFDIETPSLRGLSCLNNNIVYTANSTVAESYIKLLGKLAPNIRSTVSQIKKIFEQDYEDREYRQTGRISIKRLNSGKVTARVFDRRHAPTGKRDAAVAILVDESGSMSGSQKYVAARECCVALAEIFDQLDIPVYVMGFTADEQSHDIVHNHYIKWANNTHSRQMLLDISARSNNCDGYSIRYISKVLKKRKETNKLLIVLSDGQPAASAYGYGRDGIADTKAAIREAKKFAHVLGVAIGNSDTETIQSMYEKNFLHVSRVNDLFFGLSKELKNMFKNI